MRNVRERLLRGLPRVDVLEVLLMGSRHHLGHGGAHARRRQASPAPRAPGPAVAHASGHRDRERVPGARPSVKPLVQATHANPHAHAHAHASKASHAARVRRVAHHAQARRAHRAEAQAVDLRRVVGEGVLKGPFK